MSCDITKNGCFVPLISSVSVLCTFMQDGTTAVSYAAQYGHSDVVNLLINANADINLADKVTFFVMLQLLFLYNNYC